MKYFRYLQETGITISCVRKHVDRAKRVLLLAESAFLIRSRSLSVGWRGSANRAETPKAGQTQLPYAFLQEQGILKMPDESRLLQARILRQIERIPPDSEGL